MDDTTGIRPRAGASAPNGEPDTPVLHYSERMDAGPGSGSFAKEGAWNRRRYGELVGCRTRRARLR